MIDAESSLAAVIPGIRVNADVGRQVGAGIGLVKDELRSGALRKSVVFGLGTNGTFSLSAFDNLVRLTKGRNLVVITGHCPYCSWTPTNNAMLAAHCDASTHCAIAAWNALADQHPSWFVGDGVHMSSGGAGAKAYARLVAQALTSLGAG
jgi:hypothetical protein